VNPIGIRACYDEGKRAGETLMFDYHRMYKTKIRYDNDIRIGFIDPLELFVFLILTVHECIHTMAVLLVTLCDKH